MDNYFGYDCIPFLGYDIVCVPYMCDIVQARTHKKKRINKKWRKRYGTREVPWQKMVVVDNKIYCHPKYYWKIKAILEIKG